MSYTSTFLAIIDVTNEAVSLFERLDDDQPEKQSRLLSSLSFLKVDAGENAKLESVFHFALIYIVLSNFSRVRIGRPEVL